MTQQDTQPGLRAAARWWRIRSWHPIVLEHRQFQWLWGVQGLMLWACTGDWRGTSDNHELVLAIRWNRLRFRPAALFRAYRSWWFDSEGFRGVLGPFERIPDRGRR